MIFRAPGRYRLFPYTTLFRSQRRVIVREIQPPSHRTDDRHDDVADDRGDDRSERRADEDRKSTRVNSSHVEISYAVFCLKIKITGIEFLSSILRRSPWMRQDD